MTKAVVTLNVGSSSVKFAVFAWAEALKRMVHGGVTGLGSAPVFEVKGEPDRSLSVETETKAALAEIIAYVKARSDVAIAAVGHRIVQGGEAVKPSRLDAAEVKTLSAYSVMAPLHQPHNLEAVQAMMDALPEVPHIGCFDTAFHASLPDLAKVVALPESVREQGVRRYGYHGLSYDWIARCLAQDHPNLFSGRTIVAHLGNGASLCAMQNGQSVATTMGMTALDGLIMGTRSGALDPGIVIHLVRELGLGADGAESMLYRESGLKGLSGISNDVRVLRESTAPEAAFALDAFAHSVSEHIARLTVSLGGLDGVVFTGGIGENDADMRKAILKRLVFLEPFDALVVPANEERVIAEQVVDFLKQ